MGIAALMHYPYAAAWLELPRKESDMAWKRAAEYDSPGHPIYLATTGALLTRRLALSNPFRPGPCRFQSLG